MTDYELFLAGWNAALRSPSVDPGECFANMSPDTPAAAYRQWKNTCAQGHIVRVESCVACEKMAHSTRTHKHPC